MFSLAYLNSSALLHRFITVCFMLIVYIKVIKHKKADHSEEIKQLFTLVFLTVYFVAL